MANQTHFHTKGCAPGLVLKQRQQSTRNFSRACPRRLRVIASSFHWFVALIMFAVIDHCDYCGFGFTTLS